MNRLLTLAFSILVFTCLARRADAAPVTVPNYSMELPPLAAGG